VLRSRGTCGLVGLHRRSGEADEQRAQNEVENFQSNGE
jgi:hypothetical protein